MRVTIQKSDLKGVVTAPPSKSMAHRLLICAGLSEGRSKIENLAPSEDVLATIDCLNALGAKVSYDGSSAIVEGIGKKSRTKNPLFCRESGSTLRFFLPLCMFGEEMVLYGSDTLLKRPMDVYEKICEKLGISFSNDGEKITVLGKLSRGEFEIAGDISSQFITGLLFALPLLNGDSTIKILPPIESLPYINMTITALKRFGVTAEWQSENTLFIKGNQEYKATDVSVEGDYSNAAFFGALNSLGFDVSVLGLCEDSLQGDKVYGELFKKLDGENPVIDISNCPDLGPILIAVAAAKHGATFTGTKRLKIKESNRGKAMATELIKFGASVDLEEDKITVKPNKLQKPTTLLCGHNDHRIVMSLCVLLTITGGSIDGAEAVNKSMPNFFEKLNLLGAKITCESE